VHSLAIRHRDAGGIPPSAARRALDVAAAAVLLTLLLPAFLAVAAAVKLSGPGPVLYRQLRVGQGGRSFRLLKFRSMRAGTSGPAVTASGDPRVTRVGAVLRRTSLDELPQLWNVLKGEMSMVGPRPIVQSEVDRYEECFPLYTQVSPGLTGLWQVSGRNDTSYAERVGLDAYYVRNWSVWLDFYLLARTATVVIEGRGAY